MKRKHRFRMKGDSMMNARNRLDSRIGRRFLCVSALFLLTAGGCYKVPASVKIYAADLPARADGQYGLLDEPIKKQLVMKDAELQCKIDVEDGAEETDSAACRCAKSSSADWTADCKSWLGAHTPQPAAPSPDPQPPT